MKSTLTGWPYPCSFAAPDAIDSRREVRAVTVTGVWNNVVRYRSSRSLESSGIGAPPSNPAGTIHGVIRVQEYSRTSGHQRVMSFRAGTADLHRRPDRSPRG